MKSQIEKFYISVIVYSYCQNFNDVFRVGERKRLWEDKRAQPPEDKKSCWLIFLFSFKWKK